MSEDMDFERRLFGYLSSVMDGMKSLNATIASNIQAMGRYDVEFTKISRYHHQLTTDMIDLKSEAGQSRLAISQLRLEMGNRFSELNQRLDAVFHRLDDIENTVGDNSSQIKELQIEARSHYNDILNAIQDSSNNRISIRSIFERLENIERRLGP